MQWITALVAFEIAQRVVLQGYRCRVIGAAVADAKQLGKVGGVVAEYTDIVGAGVGKDRFQSTNIVEGVVLEVLLAVRVAVSILR